MNGGPDVSVALRPSRPIDAGKDTILDTQLGVICNDKAHVLANGSVS